MPVNLKAEQVAPLSVPSYSSIQKPCQNPVTGAQNPWGRDPWVKAQKSFAARTDLTPSDKWVLVALRIMRYERRCELITASNSDIGAYAGLSRNTVADCLTRLENADEIEFVGETVDQVQPLRLLDDETISSSASTKVAQEVKPSSTSLKCCKCKKRRRGLNKAAMCRDCAESIDIDTKVARAVEALGAGASAQDVAIFLKMPRFLDKVRKAMGISAALCLLVVVAMSLVR